MEDSLLPCSVKCHFPRLCLSLVVRSHAHPPTSSILSNLRPPFHSLGLMAYNKVDMHDLPELRCSTDSATRCSVVSCSPFTSFRWFVVIVIGDLWTASKHRDCFDRHCRSCHVD